MPPDKHLNLLLRSFRAAVAAACPDSSVRRHLPPPPAKGKIVVLGAGKTVIAMAKTIESFYAESPMRGMVVAPHGAEIGGLSRIRALTGAHPIPDSAGARAARMLIREAKSAKKNDLVIALISGGGSSLMGAPAAKLRLSDVQKTARELLRSGADVREMNVVRRHLGAASGGRLAAICRAPILALLASDVVGDRAEDIASGPCAPDFSSCEDALAVLQKYDLQCPPAVIQALQSGDLETVSDSRHFANVQNIVVANAAKSLAAGAKTLRRGGIQTIVNLGELRGKTHLLAKKHQRHLADLANAKSSFAIISGGEAEAKGGEGCGGRNTEFALHLWRIVAPQMRVLACDTDGIDGAQAAAGAMFGESHRRIAAAKKLSPAAYLRCGNSGGFFREIGALVHTGATGINVSDYRAILVP